MTVQSLALTGYSYNSAANVYNSVQISLSGIVLSEAVPTAITLNQHDVTQSNFVAPIVVVGVILSAVIFWGVRRRSAESL